MYQVEEDTSLRPKLRIRPRFSILSDKSADDLNAAVRMRLSEDDFTVIGEAITGHLTLLIPLKDRKWWSPRLTISIESEDSGSRVRGVYSPDPGLWTMFMFLYAAFGFSFVIALMWGSSRWALDQGYDGLVYSLLLLLLFAGTWLVARFGRRLSYDQMHDLHAEAERIFGPIVNH